MALAPHHLADRQRPHPHPMLGMVDADMSERDVHRPLRLRRGRRKQANIRDSASRFLQIAVGIATGTKAAGMATDWRGETLARVRALMKEADPEVSEEVKWRKASNNMQGVPVWERGGIICTGETYKDKVKLTFARGAALEDPSGLFNSSLEGNTRRAIDIKEGEEIDEAALKALIRAAMALNLSRLR
ncbi:MAG TPA: DUF1801 domain-containing protein [Allosphingosinicella sp.]|jgi:hypothetical protein|nr:DUF1801 domain-containing protein [Allosphingosinicella sp.]